MEFNIHPLVVHFPIALLSVYVVLEYIRFQRVMSRPYWFYIKAVFVIVGTVGAVIALQTGEAVEHLFRNDPVLDRVVQMHALWANSAAVIFVFLAAAYAVAWLERSRARFQYIPFFRPFWNIALAVGRRIRAVPAVLVIAAAGMAALAVTGSLGAALVHGSTVDPFVSFIYNLFF